MRRHTEPDDPVVREFARLWRAVRLLIIGSLLLFLLLASGVGLALALRGNDLEAQTRRANVESVRECFRSSASRPALHDITLDDTLALSVRSYIRQLYENTPSRRDCFELAQQLAVPADPPPAQTTIR